MISWTTLDRRARPLIVSIRLAQPACRSFMQSIARCMQLMEDAHFNLSILKGNRMISVIGLLVPCISLIKKTVFKNKNLLPPLKP